MQITIDFSKNFKNLEPKHFKTKKEAREWILEGFYGTDGAEQGHYVSLMEQLELGYDILEY